MKYLGTIIFGLMLSSFAHGEEISIKYLNSVVTVKVDGMQIIKTPYTINSSYSKAAEKMLQRMQLVYTAGKCVIINNIKQLSSEPHTSSQGNATIYGLDGSIKQKLNTPLKGSFIFPSSKKCAISINNQEGDFNSYTLLSSQCQVSNIKLPKNYKVYDGYKESFKQDKIVLFAPEAYPSKTKIPVNITISESGFVINSPITKQINMDR